MATPPTFVASYGNTAWTASAQTASITVAAGDLIVIMAGTTASAVTVNTPTGGGLTYTLQQSVASVTQQSNTYVWTAQSPSAQTFTLSLSAGDLFTWFAEVWRNHGGVGASAKRTATATTSLSLTTQGANSVLMLVDNDWNAVNGSTRTYLTSVGAFVEKAYQFQSSQGTFYGGHYADSGVVGSKSVGMSAPSGQRPSLIALEVLAASSGGTGALSITATALPTNTPPAVRIDVNDTRSVGQASALTIVRNNPDGTQVVVRTADGNPLPLSGGVGTVYDYEMPVNGAKVSYTALEAAGTTSLQVSISASQSWLVHTGVPVISTTINLLPGSLQEETYTVRQGVFYPMGRTNPVVVTDGARKGATSQLVLLAQTPSDLTAIKSIFADASPLLLNPADTSWEFGPCYIAASDIKGARFTDISIDSYRAVTVTFTVVDRPAGGSQSLRTYADVLAGNSSYAALRANYGSYAALLAGP